MKNTKLKIPVGLIIIILVLAIPTHSEIPDNHKKFICSDCHGNGRFSYGEESDDADDCGNCHVYANKQAIENMHNPMTCKICHGVKDSKTFHTIHLNETCVKCHGETGSAKPDKAIADCGGCHGGQLHVIHEENIEQLCVSCHGKIPSTTPQQLVSESKTVDKLYAKVVDYKQYTLFEILKNFLGWK